MAALIGRLRGSRGAVSRLTTKEVHSTLETWEGAIRTSLTKDGEFVVEIGDKYSPNHEVLSGNVNLRTVELTDYTRDHLRSPVG